MPKREDIKNILIIGSGPIIIGQACEFDYSGTQATKTLKSLGYKVVLINSNPATIMTDINFADKVYIEPITKEVISNIIIKENIDGILPSMGGQTALNIALQMYDKGLLKDVEFLGVKPESIKKGEDRKIFRDLVRSIGLDMARSGYATNMDDAISLVDNIGFPVIIRSSYTLGGGGSGVAYNIDEYKKLVQQAIDISPINEAFIEESLLGWKEYEVEVVRDKVDNCIIVCGIENVDPVGVHTGDSITVAPILTLTDKEYQVMRDASFKIIRAVGVDTGGSNVQFALDPKSGRMVVIEMNPRVSRSSALASKATGYPIAKVATLLAVGYTLDEITNDITGTPASFEPTLDYIVTKIPRFTFEKFPEADDTLGTSMKSVGEVMALGTNFKESFLKAFSSLEDKNLYYLVSKSDINDKDLTNEIRRFSPNRFIYIAEGFRRNYSFDEIYSLSNVDPWFLKQIQEIVDFEKNIDKTILEDEKRLRLAKSFGFSDRIISELINCKESEVYDARKKMHLDFVYNRVDTCSGEFSTETSYCYSTTNQLPMAEEKIKNKDDSKKILIIGGGPNRIGQGIEFDYCCVHASFTLKDMGIKTIMYNCNPETVSTDYDTSDELYFEPVTSEHVKSVLDRTKPDGVIVHFGGQTPLKLAQEITAHGYNIVGTSADTIDMAEDRDRFAKLLRELNILQPENGIAHSEEEALKIAKKLTYPVLVRPSYVLGGRAMQIVYLESELKKYIKTAINLDKNSPVLIDKFLQNATELDVDAICDGKDVYIGSIMEHIEEAGIHSGDSASSIPTLNISDELLDVIRQNSKKIALNLNVIGLLNIQYAIFENRVYVIEVNPRASRTVPFVSKAVGLPLAKIATRVMLGTPLCETLKLYDEHKKVYQICDNLYEAKIEDRVAFKDSVFPFNKILDSNLIFSPEMRSTGEVMGIHQNSGVSFAKAQISAFNKLPTEGTAFISLHNRDKNGTLEIAKGFIKLGFKLIATKGTCEEITKAGIECELVLKISEGRPNISDMMKNGNISIAINTGSNSVTTSSDGQFIRREALRQNIPYFTTISETLSAIRAINEIKGNDLVYSVKSLQEYLSE